MYADSHAHLAQPAFTEDLRQVLTRASAAGVERVMTCATSLADAEANLAAARIGGAGLKAAAGFHPHQAKEWNDDSEAALRTLISAAPEIAAIGEVGLDFHYDYSPRETQMEVLRTQIALARSLSLPLIVHCRNAREEIQRIFVEEKARDVGGVLHCFSEDPAFARFCVAQGFYVSFSGIVTFPRSTTIREAARVVPLDRLLAETDSPFLAPIPFRGRRNEPSLVKEVTQALATLRGEPVEDVAAATVENFDRLFGRPRAEAV